MHPELLRISLPFNVPILGHELIIYGYGLMLVLGFLAAAQLARFLAKRSGLDGEVFINAALLGLFTGIMGARISHILENLSEFTRADRSAAANFAEMLNLRSGGLTYYGGFLLAFPVLIVYAIRKKIPLRLGMDIIAPCLMIGLGFGRIGCFLNGCCYGAQCDLPWAVRFPYHSNAYVDEVQDGTLRQRPPAQLVTQESGRVDLLRPDTVAADPQLSQLAASQASNPLHPAQLYSTITAFLLAGLLLAYFTVRSVPGRVFALMLMLEGTTRSTLR